MSIKSYALRATRLQSLVGCAVAVLGGLALTASPAAAGVVWNGSQSGVWTNGDNWDGGTAPSGTSTNLNFGAATTYSITSRPSQDWGTWTFLNTAGANYNIAGGGGRANIVVEGSANATNHTVGTVRLDGRSINVESANTSLTLSADWGGQGATFTKNGVGTLIVTNTGNNPGNIALNAGTIDFQNNQGLDNGYLRLSGTNSAAVATNSTATMRTLRFGRNTNNPVLAASFAGSVTGNLNLENGRDNRLEGGVNQTFTSASQNTYTGSTTLRAGSWIVNGSHIGGDNYTVSSGLAGTTGAPNALLGGSGTIVLAAANKSFTFQGDAAARQAILRPGASDTDTATLTLGSNSIATTVNLNANSVLRVDIGAAGASDRVAIFGDLNLNGASLDLLSLAGAWDQSAYTIATFTGDLSGTFSAINGLDEMYEINYLSNAITLTYIPEPASVGLLGLSGLMLMRRRR
jgi:fibronectin-binding autotransporter adhesin